MDFMSNTPSFLASAAGSAFSSKAAARAGFKAICTQSRSCRSMAMAMTAPSVWLVIPMNRAAF